MKGFILYEGPSKFDKKPIVSIVTFSSTNEKTGNMAQLWILPMDEAPHEAVKSGNDQSVCGGCQHRHSLGGACYVLPFQGPLSVWRSYKRGLYPKSNPKALLKLMGKELRLGAYGDPAMLPEDHLRAVKSVARGTTGYSHQWKNKRLKHAMKYCQGSVDSLEEAKQFKEMYPNGHYFRVTSDISDIQEDEIQCLADTKGITCQQCMLCDGTKKNIVIEVHGSKKSRFSSDIQIKEIV